jgi:hypothetical protein
MQQVYQQAPNHAMPMSTMSNSILVAPYQPPSPVAQFGQLPYFVADSNLQMHQYSPSATSALNNQG